MAMNPVCQVQPPRDHSKEPPPKFVCGVRVRGVDKSVQCNPGNQTLRVGMKVIIATAQGDKLATVASNKLPNFKKDSSGPILNIVRIADDQDLAREQEKESRENQALNHCLELIQKLKLPMNLSRVIYLPDDNKSVFFFTAEGAADFRTTGADVDVGNAAVRPCRRQKTLGVLQVIGED